MTVCVKCIYCLKKKLISRLIRAWCYLLTITSLNAHIPLTCLIPAVPSVSLKGKPYLAVCAIFLAEPRKHLSRSGKNLGSPGWRNKPFEMKRSIIHPQVKHRWIFCTRWICQIQPTYSLRSEPKNCQPQIWNKRFSSCRNQSHY